MKNGKLKGLFHDDDNYYTYDHLLPDGIGDNATKEQLDMLYKTALKDVEILKDLTIKSQIGKDDMGLPFVDLI